MDDVRDIASIALLLGGLAFFVAATAGVMRFPDALSRLHAAAKADNAGLFLVVLSLLVRAPAISTALKLLTIWGLALVASAATSQLIGWFGGRAERERRS